MDLQGRMGSSNHVAVYLRPGPQILVNKSLKYRRVIPQFGRNDPELDGIETPPNQITV
jgi:hypothetical protein